MQEQGPQDRPFIHPPTRPSTGGAQPTAEAPPPPASLRVPAWLQTGLFVIVAVGLATYVHLLSPNIIAGDSLYHLRHASLNAHRGLLFHEFPWATYSVFRLYAADIWYGFHVLLAPFSLIQHPPILAVKAAGIGILTALLLLLYWAMRRLQMGAPYLWPFLALFPFLWRFAQVRPHVLSSGIVAILFSLLLSGSAWAVLAASLVLSWVHLAFFWLGILAAVTVTIARRLVERRWEWRKPLAAFAGAAAGWLLRPNPIGAAKILNVQLFRLLLVKQELAVGVELRRMDALAVVANHGSFLALWLVLAVVWIAFQRRASLPAQTRVLLWSSLALSAAFLGMVIAVSQRALDQWALFGTFFCAGMLANARETMPMLRKGERYRSAAAMAALLFALLAGQSMYGKRGYVYSMTFAVRPQRLRGASQWLRDHSRPGEIVFHANWSPFYGLFFWNTHNRYIGGLDPVFQYAYDRRLYWKAHHLAFDGAGSTTWGTPGLTPRPAEREDTYRVIRRDFRASYVILDSSIARPFGEYVSQDPRFVRRYADAEAEVFQLADAIGSPAKR